MNRSCVSNYIVKIEKAEIDGGAQPKGTSACVDAYNASVDPVSTAVKVHASVQSFMTFLLSVKVTIG